MADTERVDVSEGAERLISVKLYEGHRNRLLALVVVLEDAEDSLRHVIHDNVQVDLVVLVALRVERMLQRDDVRVVELTHDLQLSVLVPLVLVDLLDGDGRVQLDAGGLVDDSERAVADDALSIVSEARLLLVALLLLRGLALHYLN